MPKINFFLLGGRTGGPLSPYPAILDRLNLEFRDSKTQLNPIMFGVKGGFETNFCESYNLPIFYLAQAKLDILSFKKSGFISKIFGLIMAFWTFAKVTISIFVCTYYLIRFRPKLIISTGSFLAIPMVFGSRITNFLGFTKTKVAIHQLDPAPGLSNRICVRFADLLSCIFVYTRQNYKNFGNALVIPNPVLESKFTKNNQWKNKQLQEFFDHQTTAYTKSNLIYNQPIFLIFGGGSGSKTINEWVWSNLELLVDRYRVVHLTGILQSILSSPKDQELASNLNYLSLDSVYQDMGNLMASSDLIICRAGVGTIAELDYLGSRAFVVPIPNTHQELNAELVSDRYTILDQNNTENWLELINSNSDFGQGNRLYDKVALDEYYNQLFSLIIS